MTDSTGFDMGLARRAYSGISFDPDRRAEQDRDSFLAHIANVRERLAPLAQTDEQRAILDAEMAQYRAGYLSREHAHLAAKGRTISPMIAGPSNFPARRNEKRLNTERKRLEEMLDWAPRAEAAIRKNILAARTPDQADDALLRGLKREIDRDMATVRGIDHDMATVRGIDHGTLPYYRQGFVTGIVDRLRRAIKNGHADTAAVALAYIEEQQAGWAKPFLTKRSGIWREVDDARAQQGGNPLPVLTGQVTVAEVPGLTVIRNHDLARVQLLFDGKPDEATRAHLKENGWHWSPREGAWQRQLTANAEAAASRVVTLWGAR